LRNPDDATLHLWCYRLVQLTGRNSQTAADRLASPNCCLNRVSGDLVALGAHDVSSKCPPARSAPAMALLFVEF